MICVTGFAYMARGSGAKNCGVGNIIYAEAGNEYFPRLLSQLKVAPVPNEVPQATMQAMYDYYKLSLSLSLSSSHVHA